MKLCDHHLHSEFSDDSETELTDIVEQALHLGMSEICITDHHDIDYPKDEEGHTFLLDTDRYISAVRKLQEQYKNKLTIRLGVELGLMSHIADKIIAYTDKYHDFDFIIGSSHLVYGKDPYYPAYYEGRSEKKHCWNILNPFLQMCKPLIIIPYTVIWTMPSVIVHPANQPSAFLIMQMSLKQF